MIRWLLIVSLAWIGGGCEERTASRFLDNNPEYAGQSDEHAMLSSEWEDRLRQRVLMIQTDR